MVSFSAERHFSLPVHQIDPGHQLGHRMLDLQPRVHLEEIELPFSSSRNSIVPALV
jgi:hypothetical protein